MDKHVPLLPKLLSTQLAFRVTKSVGLLRLLPMLQGLYLASHCCCGS